jgi:hypothetical protein
MVKQSLTGRFAITAQSQMNVLTSIKNLAPGARDRGRACAPNAGAAYTRLVMVTTAAFAARGIAD